MALAQKNFEEIITFTRASAGGRFNSTGTYEMVPAGQQRIDYDPLTLAIKGFLVEEAKTNLLIRTNSVSTFEVESFISYQAELVRFVDGITPFRKLVEGWNTNAKTAQTYAVPYTAGVTCTFSCFAKTAGRRLHVGLPEGVTATWNLTDGSFITTGGGIANATNLGNGVWRVSLTFTPTVTIAPNRIVLRLVNDSNLINYQGDGESGVYVGGIQMEEGAVATSYNPSTDTFSSRSSTATYFDSNKVLKTAAVNEARSSAYDWDGKGGWKPVGLLAERAATNLALQSNSATTFSSVVGATYNDVGQLFVDGVTPFRKLVESNANESHRGVSSSGAIPANSVYTTSFIIKPAGRTKVRMLMSGGNMDYDLVAMTATKQLPNAAIVGSVQRYGNGFFRITRTATVGETDQPGGVSIYLLDDAATPSATYQGDGVSGVLVGGFQVEVGAFASSYIPTTTAQVTRAADVVASAQTTRAADVPVINDLGEWYNQSEGTLYVEAIPLGVPSGIYACLNDGNLNNRLQVDSVTTGGRLTVIAGGSTQVSMIGSAVPLAGQVQKTAASFKANDFAICANGGLIKTDTVGILPTMSRLSFMAATVGGQPNAHLRVIKYFPRKLTDAELQVLTV